MRRTTIRLAIVALLVGSSAWAQEIVPGQPMGSAQPTPPMAGQDTNVSGGYQGIQQVPLQPSPEAGGAPPQQQWQPLETIVAMPDPTTSGTVLPEGTIAEGEIPMLGTMVQTRPHGPCCEKTARGYCCPPNWYLDQRVRVLHHPKPRGTILGAYGSVGQAYNGIEIIDVFSTRNGLSTRSLAFEPAAGYDITIGRYLGRDSDNRDQFLEFTYYGMNHWEQNAAMHQTDRPTVFGSAFGGSSVYPIAANLPATQSETFGNLYSVFDHRLAGFNRADNLDARYASRFDNFELNVRVRPRLRHDRMVLYQNGLWRRETQEGCSFSFLAGLRGMSLDESFLLCGSGQIVVEEYNVPVAPETTTATTRGEYDVRTHNDMVGLQIGGDAVYRKGFAELGIRMKGGVFINFADQISSILSTGGLDDPMGDVELYDVNGPYTDVNNQYYEERLARSRDVAGVAELGFTASYQVRANMVIRAAYDLMWLSGVALAPEQVDGQIGVPGRVNRNGLQFMQSLSLGIELDW